MAIIIIFIYLNWSYKNKMWWITGDIHGTHSIGKLSNKNWKEQHDYEWSKNDIVCIVGDFGLFWGASLTKTEKYWLDWLKERPYTVVFVDGNHENFERINSFDTVDFYGGTAGQAWDSIFHLKRGEIYIYQEKKIFTFGGATSHDKQFRKEYISWWPEECPSFKEIDYALINLESYDNRVDYIITHTGPKAVLEVLGFSDYTKCLTSEFLDNVLRIVAFDQWFFGHLHIDNHAKDYRYNALYNDIIQMI